MTPQNLYATLSAEREDVAMKGTQFLATVARDEAGGGRKGACGHLLGPRTDGEHHRLHGEEVCEDCYFDAMPNNVGRLRPRPRGSSITD